MKENKKTDEIAEIVPELKQRYGADAKYRIGFEITPLNDRPIKISKT
jgi:hypothetical protein